MSDEKKIFEAPQMPTAFPAPPVSELPKVSSIPTSVVPPAITPSTSPAPEIPKFPAPNFTPTTNVSQENVVPSIELPNVPLQKPDISAQNSSQFATQQVQLEGKTLENESKTEKKEGVYDNNFAADLNLPPKVLQTKIMGSIVAGLFFFGMMMGCMMSGGEVVQTTNGLQGVVFNPDAPPGTYRCGIAPLTRGCVLYIMNSKNYDRKGADFYQEAQNITGVPSYTLQLSNVRYASTPIQPGYIAEIYIPPR